MLLLSKITWLYLTLNHKINIYETQHFPRNSISTSLQLNAIQTIFFVSIHNVDSLELVMQFTISLEMHT